jgi:peptidoglycan-associated lipoprotein
VATVRGSIQRSIGAWWVWALGAVFLGLVSSGCPRQPVAPSGATGQGGSLYGQPSLSGQPGEVVEREIPPGERVERRLAGEGERSPLQDLHFAYDSYDLSYEAQDTLQTNARWLQTNPQARVEIEGHCDERGTNEYNLALGAQRARAVREYLVTLGIATGRLSTISYGEELPLCREQTENCWQQNRRAHFLVLIR